MQGVMVLVFVMSYYGLCPCLTSFTNACLFVMCFCLLNSCLSSLSLCVSSIWLSHCVSLVMLLYDCMSSLCKVSVSCVLVSNCAFGSKFYWRPLQENNIPFCLLYSAVWLQRKWHEATEKLQQNPITTHTGCEWWLQQHRLWQRAPQPQQFPMSEWA